MASPKRSGARGLLSASLASVLWLALSHPSVADPVKLRIATVAPEGSGWAREMHGFSRDVEVMTGGKVQVRWILGGIAGDEFTSLARTRKGQVDGAGLTIACESLAPSLHVMRMAGLLRSNAEARYVFSRLHPRLEKEFARAGFFDFGVGTFGPIIIFSRTPIRTLAELQKTRAWVWDKDDIWVGIVRRLGIQAVPMPVEAAARAYEEHRIDAFLTVPSAAMVFQQTTLARYYTELRLGMLPVCFVMAQRSMDELPVAERDAFAGAAGKLSERFQDISRDLDDQLINGLLQKQGLIRVPPSESFTSEFFEAARRVRDTFDPNEVPPAVLNEVLSWLADYRAEHLNSQ